MWNATKILYYEDKVAKRGSINNTYIELCDRPTDRQILWFIGKFSQCSFSVLLRGVNAIKVWANAIKVWANAI